MKTRTIFTLAFIVIVLGTLYYFDYRRVVERESAEVEQTQLTALAADQIDSLTIQNSFGKIELEKRADGWWITSPVKDRADRNVVVDALLPTLTSARKYNPFEIAPKASGGATEGPATNPWAPYGLDRPTVTVAARSSATGKSVEFSLGDETAIKGECYLRDKSDSARAYVTADTLRKAFDRNLIALRDKTVLDVEPQNLYKVTIHQPETPDHPARQLIAQKDPAGVWTIAEQDSGEGAAAAPAPALVHPADPRVMEGILRFVRAMPAADSVTPDTLGRFGLNGSVVKLGMEYWRRGDDGKTSAPATATFRFGAGVAANDAPTTGPILPVEPAADKGQSPLKYYALREGNDVSYAADAKLVAMLREPLQSYRDRRLFTFKSDEVAYLQIEVISSAVALTREPGGAPWAFAADPATPVSQERVRAYVEICLKMGIDSFTPDPPAADAKAARLENPTIRITMANADRSVRQGFEVGGKIADESPFFYARRTYAADPRLEGEIFSLALPAQLLRALLQSEKNFIARPLLSFDSKDVSRLQFISSKAEGSTLTLTRVFPQGLAPQWQGSVSGKEPKVLPEKDCWFLLAAIKSMEYVGTVAAEKMTDPVLEKTGLKNPTYSIRLWDRQGKSLGSVSFGDLGRAENTFVLNDRGEYFYVSSSVFEGPGQALDALISRLK